MQKRMAPAISYAGAIQAVSGVFNTLTSPSNQGSLIYSTERWKQQGDIWETDDANAAS
jgi:hypothetical protein